MGRRGGEGERCEGVLKVGRRMTAHVSNGFGVTLSSILDKRPVVVGESEATRSICCRDCCLRGDIDRRGEDC